jgi:phenylacetate-coenzyme A ligase PaaK-like adenylate-forming protein
MLLEEFIRKRPRLLNSFLRLCRHWPGLLESIGRQKLYRVFRQAVKHVPAYRTFVEEHLRAAGIPWSKVNSISGMLDNSIVPPTDKLSYVVRYPIQSRCLHGQLPLAGTVAESGGSSGKPTMVLHSYAEDQGVEGLIRWGFGLLYGIRNKRTLIVNGWALGTWGTGIKFACSSLNAEVAVIQNIGTDAPGILDALKIRLFVGLCG